jgi:hypothetical protein
MNKYLNVNLDHPEDLLSLSILNRFQTTRQVGPIWNEIAHEDLPIASLSHETSMTSAFESNPMNVPYLCIKKVVRRSRYLNVNLDPDEDYSDLPDLEETRQGGPILNEIAHDGFPIASLSHETSMTSAFSGNLNVFNLGYKY